MKTPTSHLLAALILPAAMLLCQGIISLDASMMGYDEIAARHGLTEGAVKAAAHHLRQKFREVLRGAIAETVVSEDEIDDEIQHLFKVFQAP